MVAGPPPPYQLHASEKDNQPQMLDIARQARGKVGKGKGKRVGKGEEGVKTSGGRGRKGSKGRGGDHLPSQLLPVYFTPSSNLEVLQEIGNSSSGSSGSSSSQHPLKQKCCFNKSNSRISTKTKTTITAITAYGCNCCFLTPCYSKFLTVIPVMIFAT